MEINKKSAVAPEKLKGTKTETNLHTAFSAETQAYIRYKIFENKAKEDGYEAVAELFKKTADNEMEHAEVWFRYLGGACATEHNLDAAAKGEKFEWSKMYSRFAEEARAEGFKTIGDIFERIASVEKTHEDGFKKLLDTVKKGEMFTSKADSTKWLCIKCGYVVFAKEPPKTCPACSHPQGFFKNVSKR